MQLVIMAAGMGSRFGGLKQLTPIDNNNNFIIDYSIFDAIRCEFNKVVFIIKEEHYDLFRETVGKRVEKQVETKYVFQNNNNVPAKYQIPADRTKPLGTAHAILCAKPVITDDFAVINADDFYGYDAFKTASDFLKAKKGANKYCVVGYEAINTIGESGSVKRGICDTTNGLLKSIDESSIRKEGSRLFAKTIDTENAIEHEIKPNTLVSMNMFGFPKEFVNHLDEKFLNFLEEHKNNMSTCECYLPLVVSDLINEKKASVEVLSTSAVWYGMTYKEDRDNVVKSIKALVDKGDYPTNLWN